MRTVIVPQGLSADYYFFLEITVSANSMAVLVDRRRAVRRQPSQETARHPERRSRERRGPLPTTWGRDGYMIIGGAE